MSFTDEQKAELAAPLNRAHVKPPAPGKFGEYIEGWRVIDEANRIFGFDGWTRETVEMVELCRDLVELTGKNGPYKQWRVSYMAKVRVQAGGIVREGTGCGSGSGKPEALGDTIESAVKEAETDAMKRALMTFGNPFGLALYDKTKANVADEPDASLQIALDGIAACDTVPMLQQWWTRNSGAIPDHHMGEVEAAYIARGKAVSAMDKVAA